MQKKAAKVGFDWPDVGPCGTRSAEEMRELSEAANGGNPGKVEDEVGDLLFSVVNLSRFLKVDPSVALHSTNVKFERGSGRSKSGSQPNGTSPAEAGLARMDQLWNQVKSE